MGRGDSTDAEQILYGQTPPRRLPEAKQAGKEALKALNLIILCAVKDLIEEYGVEITSRMVSDEIAWYKKDLVISPNAIGRRLSKLTQKGLVDRMEGSPTRYWLTADGQKIADDLDLQLMLESQ